MTALRTALGILGTGKDTRGCRAPTAYKVQRLLQEVDVVRRVLPLHKLREGEGFAEPGGRRRGACGAADFDDSPPKNRLISGGPLRWPRGDLVEHRNADFPENNTHPR